MDDGPRGLELFSEGAVLPSIESFRASDGTYLMPNWAANDVPPGIADLHPVIAILDSGVMQEHPLIAPRLVGSLDTTGEGPEDEIGHGTAVAILAVLDAPNIRILNVKVFGRERDLDRDILHLADGIRLAVEHGDHLIQLCVGDRRPCSPRHEPLCKAVKEALDRGRRIIVAGEATCPGGCDERVWTVAEFDRSTREVHGMSERTIFTVPSRGQVANVPWRVWASTNADVAEGA